jgi:hypothetical protein
LDGELKGKYEGLAVVEDGGLDIENCKEVKTKSQGISKGRIYVAVCEGFD